MTNLPTMIRQAQSYYYTDGRRPVFIWRERYVTIWAALTSAIARHGMLAEDGPIATTREDDDG